MSNPSPGFIRVKLLELDPPPKTKKTTIMDPFCAVTIKEMIKLDEKAKSNGFKYFFLYIKNYELKNK